MRAAALLALALAGCGRPCVAPDHAAILAEYRATDAADRRAAVDSVDKLRARLDSDIAETKAQP